MQTLTRASQELFRREPDECFPSLVALWQHCHEQQQRAEELWPTPTQVRPTTGAGRLRLMMDEDRTFDLNQWSFSQLCKLAKVSKETVNKLSPDTARQVLDETLARGGKPLQVYARDDRVQAVHGTTYTRLYNSDLLTMVREFATDFVPPQQAGARGEEGRTGLYCGEQDMFCFLIDPAGWTEIGSEAFAPGFFVWNSEVGRRSLGIQTFWFQAICQNHIVWDAVEVVEFSRKHTANVYDSLREVRGIIERLVDTRDQRRDGFIRIVRRAMETTFGTSTDEAIELLGKRGFTKTLAKEALELARSKGRFTIFSVVDALTRLSGKMPNAGERSDADRKAASLLAMAV